LRTTSERVLKKEKWVEKIAKAASCSHRTAQLWLRRGCPKTADLEKILEWRKAQSAARRGVAGGEYHDRWVQEFRKWKAKKQRLEYLREMGKVIELETAKSWLVELLTICRQALVALPDHLAGEVYRSCGNRMTSVQVSESSKMVVRQVLLQIRQRIAEAGGFELSDDEAEKKDSNPTQEIEEGEADHDRPEVVAQAESPPG
jgi:hypothetical protein